MNEKFIKHNVLEETCKICLSKIISGQMDKPFCEIDKIIPEFKCPEYNKIKKKKYYKDIYSQLSSEEYELFD